MTDLSMPPGISAVSFNYQNVGVSAVAFSLFKFVPQCDCNCNCGAQSEDESNFIGSVSNTQPDGIQFEDSTNKEYDTARERKGRLTRRGL
jgi:hypothetical protein